jgi:hypothetical protein
LCAVHDSVLIYAEMAVMVQNIGTLQWSRGYRIFLEHVRDYTSMHSYQRSAGHMLQF